MLKEKALSVSIIATLILSSCITINYTGDKSSSESKPTPSSPSISNIVKDLGNDQINNNNIDSKPLVVKPSSTAIPTTIPIAIPTPITTSTPIIEDTYTLYKTEVEVNLNSFIPDGIHGGEAPRELFYYKGPMSELKLPAYDPLRGLEELKEGNIVINWYYDNNANYKTSGSWNPPPTIIKDGDIIPVEESATLHNRVGVFVEGNINTRVHFGNSNYYYLVTGDAEFGKDPNIIWYNNSNGEGTKVGSILKNKVDKKLNLKNYNNFAINIFYSFGGRGFAGWWYYYKK
ncbi:MAG: hypothetical protein U0457_03165 [Candidatus Sericytochromatia bacterium]